MSQYNIGIDPDLDGLLDPQQCLPAGWCPECGAEIWEEGKELCARCERHSGTEPLVKESRHTFIITASTPMLRGLIAWLERKGYKFQEVQNADV